MQQCDPRGLDDSDSIVGGGGNFTFVIKSRSVLEPTLLAPFQLHVLKSLSTENIAFKRNGEYVPRFARLNFASFKNSLRHIHGRRNGCALECEIYNEYFRHGKADINLCLMGGSNFMAELAESSA